MDRFLEMMARSTSGYRQDRKYFALLIVVLTLVLFTLVVCAIAVWPVIFSLARGGSDLASFFLILGGVGIALSLVIALAIPIANYTFVKSLTLGYGVNFIFMLILFWARHVTLPGLDGSDFYMELLRIVFGFPVGAVLGLLPACVGNLLGWLVRMIFAVISGR